MSGQWDVLIYNALDTPVLHIGGGASVLPIEGVLAAISVKSNVDRKALEDAANAAGQLREMPRDPIPSKARSEGPLPAVFVFGFKGLSLDTLRTHALDACEGPGSPRVFNGVCVLRSGFVAPVNREGNVSFVEIESYRIAESADGAWGFFLTLLWTALYFQPGVAPHLMRYVKPGQIP